jgi:hypothetical protein
MSQAELFTVGPRFTGALQGLFVVGRAVIQMSIPPEPPGRSEGKNSDRPSAEILAAWSQEGLFTVGPIFTSGPQGLSIVGRAASYSSKLPVRSEAI